MVTYCRIDWYYTAIILQDFSQSHELKYPIPGWISSSFHVFILMDCVKLWFLWNSATVSSERTISTNVISWVLSAQFMRCKTFLWFKYVVFSDQIKFTGWKKSQATIKGLISTQEKGCSVIKAIAITKCFNPYRWWRRRVYMSSEINEVAKVSVSIFFQKSQESIAFFITFFFIQS